MDRDVARGLDLVAAAAIASPVVATVAGWRCAADPGGPFRRANAVLPGPKAGANADEDRQALAAVRTWYRPYGQRLLVQVSDAGRHHGSLDQFLADQGLGVEAPVDVLVAPNAPLGSAPDPTVAVQSGIDEVWSSAHGVLVGDDASQARRARGYGRGLSAHGAHALGASVRRDGEVAGVGFGVVGSGWLGVFGMATDPARRRQGVATAVVQALWAAADDLGARRAYLQVEEDNVAAAGLYRSLGFSPHHQYHYRSEGRAPDSEGC